MKQKEIVGIGPVLFKQSERAKYIRVIVQSSSNIVVIVPKGISFQQAEEFVKSKKAWIKKHQSKLQLLEQNYTASAVDRRKAKALLQKRLNQLSREYSLPYNKLTIRNQKTRWGSCSCKNNISLNYKLVLLPEELLDYVLVHELVHTKIKNHGTRYWSKLDSLIGYARTKDMRLKQYRFLLSTDE